jgi:hypothetical protein
MFTVAIHKSQSIAPVKGENIVKGGRAATVEHENRLFQTRAVATNNKFQLTLAATDDKLACY